MLTTDCAITNNQYSDRLGLIGANNKKKIQANQDTKNVSKIQAIFSAMVTLPENKINKIGIQ